MGKSQSVTLFLLGGDGPSSDSITVNPAHVESVEPYKRAGKPPTVPRCIVKMFSGATHRVLGESDHVLEWLGWDVCPAADAYKKFMALRKPAAAPKLTAAIPKPVAGDTPEPAVVVPEPAAGDVSKPAAGNAVSSGMESL